MENFSLYIVFCKSNKYSSFFYTDDARIMAKRPVVLK